MEENREDEVSVSPPQPAARDGATSLLWPRRQEEFNRADFEAPCFRCDAVAASDNLVGTPTGFGARSFSQENLPCLKSMTWTMENRGSSPADRVAIISLKLHDYSKSPSAETEVKFQLTRDTLEAMLTCMTCISEQLSAVGTSSEPANKKQKQ